MFAVGITGVNLNDPTTKYFNIAFAQKTVDSVHGKTTVNYALQPCNITEWTDLNTEFTQSFNKLGLS
jgi:hypothetical protein